MAFALYMGVMVGGMVVGGTAIGLAAKGVEEYVKKFHPTKKQLEMRLLKLNSINQSEFKIYRRLAPQRKKFIESLGYKYPMTKPELIGKIKVFEDKINKKVKEQEIEKLQQKIKRMKNNPSRKSTKRRKTKRRKTKRRKTKKK